MLTLGIDFAAQPKSTAASLVRWAPGRAEIKSLTVPADDNAVVALSVDADKIGVDVPLGWPNSFIKAVGKHQVAEKWPSSTNHELRYRRTDVFVHSKTKRWPLSVSTDRIGVAAFRAARLIPKLVHTKEVDRTGGAKVVEVYPKAALLRWGLKPTSKKQTRELFAALLSATSTWLRITDEMRPVLESNRDALDSLIAAIITRAAALGLCELIPPEDLSSAKQEGWIALPLPDSLSRLAGPSL